jgi:hypothetical protein
MSYDQFVAWEWEEYYKQHPEEMISDSSTVSANNSNDYLYSPVEYFEGISLDDLLRRNSDDE